VNALADPKVGKYLDEHFVAAFQKVGTFRIVGKQKQGGNVACYFCAPDGRVLHAVAGPVDAATLLRESQWIVDTAKKGVELAKGDGGKFKVFLRTAHADKLRRESGLAVEPITFDPPEPQDPKDTLTYRDPTGRPLAPMLKLPPIDGPDVRFRAAQEALAKKGAGGVAVRDRDGRTWVLGTQGRVEMLMAAHALVPIERLYASIFEEILGERISTRPVEIVNPFPWHKGK
jgi:hypothetical protein